MRVLYLTNHLQNTDGWSRYSTTLIDEVKNQGHEVLVVSSEVKVSNGVQPQLTLGEPLGYLLNFYGNLRQGRKLARLLASWRPDVLHILVEPYANLLPFCQIPNQTKVFLTIHGTFSYPPNLFQNLIKKQLSKWFLTASLRKINQIIAVSNFTRDYFLANMSGKKRPPVRVITNGVKLPTLSPCQKSSIPQVIFVGAVKERKGLLESIEGIKSYLDQYAQDLRFLIVGKFDPQDSYYQKLVSLIKSSGLEGLVRFTGPLSESDLERRYAESELLLLLPKSGGPRFEGFGLVYLEANARGIPVIGAIGSGAPEAISDGRSGFVVDGRDPGEVARKINQILNNKVINSADCLAWARENQIEVKVKQLLTLYGSSR